MCAPPAYSSTVLASSCVCMEYAVVEALGDVRISAKAIRKYRQIIPHNIAGIGLIFMIFGVNAANKVSKGYTILCLLLFREKNNINMADKKSKSQYDIEYAIISFLEKIRLNAFKIGL